VTESEPGSSGIRATLLEAIRGSSEDLTSIPLRRAVVLLAVPTVLEMSMESLLTVVDIFFVSRLGSGAVAAVGLTESMLSPVYALAMGLSAGATALIARRTGEKDGDGAASGAVQVLLAAVVGAAVLGVIGLALSSRLLGLMGASADVVALGSRYTAIMLGGSVTIFLLFVFNAIFRAAGDAAVAMRSLAIANGLNMVLAPCFVFGLGPIPRMGVSGAALATTLSRGIGVGYQLLILLGRSGRLSIARRHLRLHLATMTELLRIASPAALQILVETLSWLALVRILSVFGSSALAGYTIAMRVAIFALLPPWGLANAAATLVGQNLGARAPERATESVRTIARYNLVFLGAVGLVFALVPHAIVSLFMTETTDPQVAVHAASCLRIVALGFVFFAYGMVAMQAFNGAGDTLTPMLVNVGSFWGFKIPLAWFLARRMGMGPDGVFVAIAVAYSLQSVVAAVLFRRGGWQKTKVGEAPS